ncbi:hypothetical protein CCP3SC1_890001 [Gammaproteobacteria bacterium]
MVQQAQGRVRPTIQMKDGVAVNDDVGLEREADLMGGKAVQMAEGQKARLGPSALQTDKIKENESRVVTNSVTQKKSNLKQYVGVCGESI